MSSRRMAPVTSSISKLPRGVIVCTQGSPRVTLLLQSCLASYYSALSRKRRESMRVAAKNAASCMFSFLDTPDKYRTMYHFLESIILVSSLPSRMVEGGNDIDWGGGNRNSLDVMRKIQRKFLGNCCTRRDFFPLLYD